MSNDLVIGMAGSGGDGIVSAGDAMITAAALEGYHAVLTKSFGPQIRGGESSCRVRLSTTPVLSSGGTLDVAVALNWEDFLKFGAELPVGGRTTVVYESATGVPRGAAAAPRGDAVGGDRGPDRRDGEEERGDGEGEELRRPRAARRLARGGARVAPRRHPEEVRQEGRRGPAGERERLRRRRAVRRGPPAARAAHARRPRPGR